MMETIGTPQTYLAALSASLSQKEKVMAELLEVTKKQEQVLAAQDFDMDAFDFLMNRKGKLLEALEKLDAGFEQVYGHVREALQQDVGRYRDSVRELQERITRLTEMGVSIETLERRNRDRLEGHLSVSRGKIRNFKVSNQAAAKYYKNMANRHQGESYFLDKKK